MQCRDLADVLAAVDEPLSGRARRHVDRCLRCQAERAQYRRLVRSVATLRDQPTFTPPLLVEDILDYVRAATDAAHRTRTALVRRFALAGGVAAVAGGAVAGAVALARHGHLRGLANLGPVASILEHAPKAKQALAS